MPKHPDDGSQSATLRGTIRAMHGGRFSWCVLFVLSIAACGDREAAARGKDEAIFELGADSPPLADVLKAAARNSAARPPSLQAPLSIPASPKPTRYRTVVLGAGETLAGLCAKHLGDAGRWRQVAELNGWTEDDLRRLSTGTEVRLPMER